VAQLSRGGSVWWACGLVLRATGEKCGDSSRKTVALTGSGLTLPHGEHRPAGTAQRTARPHVAGRVAVDLGHPIGAPGRRDAAAAAGVLVPETAVDVDDLAQAGKGEIGR